MHWKNAKAVKVFGKLKPLERLASRLKRRFGTHQNTFSNSSVVGFTKRSKQKNSQCHILRLKMHFQCVLSPPACFPHSSPLAASWTRQGTNDQAATIPPSKHHNHLLHLLLLHSRSRMTRPQHSLLHFGHFSPPALHLLQLATRPTMTSLPQSHSFLYSPPPSMVLVGELSFLTVPQFFQRWNLSGVSRLVLLRWPSSFPNLYAHLSNISKCNERFVFCVNDWPQKL